MKSVPQREAFVQMVLAMRSDSGSTYAPRSKIYQQSSWGFTTDRLSRDRLSR